ncbi:MAG: ribonuclease HII [Candidatus Yanofskybacteria bacterium]|nr:ribonuclease HII [Candidatus Yanofskybacteria bacterium]
MTTPSWNEERKLQKEGYTCVAGIDEAGRGPLAGPVIAAAVCFPAAKDSLALLRTLKIRDSKQLSFEQREKLYAIFTSHPNIEWGIGKVGERVIDALNIYHATKLAMTKAVLHLNKKLQRKQSAVEFLLLDGTMLLDLSLPQKAIIRGDEKVMACAVASIIAKVTRDRLMVRYHAKYPQYGFDKHKGYGTSLHMEMLEKYGPSPIHRKTFAPLNYMRVIDNTGRSRVY